MGIKHFYMGIKHFYVGPMFDGWLHAGYFSTVRFMMNGKGYESDCVYIGNDGVFYYLDWTVTGVEKWAPIEGSVSGVDVDGNPRTITAREAWQIANSMDRMFCVLELGGFAKDMEVYVYKIEVDADGNVTPFARPSTEVLNIDSPETYDPETWGTWQKWQKVDLAPGSLEEKLFGGVTLEWYREHPEARYASRRKFRKPRRAIAV
jgi:hypothetical protein